MRSATRLHKVEEDLLLEAIFHRYGYDFRNYARASLSRRLKDQVEKAKVSHVSDLIPKVLYDENYFRDFLMSLTLNVTEMFRDPHFYLAFKKWVLPNLTTYPFLKIWHAGCATGQEVYSIAILLQEANLLNRVNIYGTDINLESLKTAKEGIYPLKLLKQYQDNYMKAGGEYSLNKYFYNQYDYAIMTTELKNKMLFAEHNLACDHAFGEMNVIICRNVLIYFNIELQKTVLQLFYDSLCYNGFLCLGDKESIEFTGMKEKFELLDKNAKIYRKIGQFS